MARLAAKVAIVSGATQGMGASHARGIAAEGGRVLVCGRDKDQGEVVAAELGELGRFQYLDVTEPAGWAEAMSVAVEWGAD